MSSMSTCRTGGADYSKGGARIRKNGFVDTHRRIYESPQYTHHATRAGLASLQLQFFVEVADFGASDVRNRSSPKLEKRVVNVVPVVLLG